ncbi:MAG: hypothetical protein IJV31_04130, partial [Clostridia bacterium]|nr:hypothetical protein [Clostridia bacterium]
MKREILRKNNGITLITIAITIIILLILSGITISMMTGDSGLARRAEKTKQSSDDNVLIETLQIEITNCYDERGNLDMEKVKDVLEKSKTFDVGKYNKDLIANYGERAILIENTGDLTIIGEDIKPNPPKLTSGMIPVKYDTQKENWVICSKDDEEWYSYTSSDKKWANIMLSDGKYNEQTPIGTVVQEQDLGSMFVWIPRYAYKITSGYHSNGYGEIDVKWVDGTSYYYLDENKKPKVAQNGNTEGVITSTGYTDYVVHPAFTDGSSNSYSNGEWKKEVTGIWVAKFEAGIYTNSNDTNAKISSVNNYYFPVFKGKKYAYNYVTVSQSYNISLALSKSGNPYGLTTNANSHLLKNSEWGASSYLSISKYGYTGGNTDGQEVYKNNLGLVDNTKYTTSNVSNPNNSSWKIVAITGYCAPEKASSQNIMTYTSYNDLKAEVNGTNGKSYAWNNVEKNSDSG